MTGNAVAALEQSARPLLELMQAITGLETSFITGIDRDAQEQEILFALNTSDLVVAEGSTLDWSDSMCRLSFLSGREQTSDVPGAFPGSLGAEVLGMQTFFAVPVLAGERTIGTVCGASRRVVELDDGVLHMMRLVAQAIAVQLQTEQQSKAHLDRATRAEVLSLTDELTGLANRRAYSSRTEQELARSGRHEYPVAVLMIDVDDFKKVNDGHGHDVGDKVLQAVGRAMAAASRAEDVVARLGGDEFAITASYVDSSGAFTLGERVRFKFAEQAAELGLSCSLSVGVSASDRTARADLMFAADGALYQSKRHGRDRVELAVTPVAMTTARDTTRPRTRPLVYVASKNTYTNSA